MQEKKQATEQVHDPEGWWVLTSYHDKILSNKKIGAYSFSPAAWEAVLVHVSGDSVKCFGTITNGKHARNTGSDTLLVHGGIASQTFFCFDPSRDRLSVSWQATETVKSGTTSYRRLAPGEQNLTTGLLTPAPGQQLEINYHNFFIRKLIAGTYHSVEKPAVTMKLNADETMSGFGKWNKHEVDDFFGTLHWLGKLDRIRFSDTTIAYGDFATYNSDKGPFRDYNWKFSGDTLILREFTGNDIELYKPGNKTLRFIKLKK